MKRERHDSAPRHSPYDMGNARRHRESLRIILALLLLLPMLFACSRKTEEPVLILPAELPVPEAEPVTAESDLPQSWYGSFRVDAAEGYFSELVGKQLDCTGALEDSVLTLRIAALDGEDYLGRVRLSEAGDECLGGEMLDRVLQRGGCSVVTEEDSMTLTGDYTSKDGGNFRYTVLLRPWGEYWDGEKLKLPEDYFDWYLPLLRAGEEMPDTLWDEQDSE